MKLVYSTLFLLFSIVALATAQNSELKKSKLSASTKYYLWQQQHKNYGIPKPMPEFVYRMDANQKIYVSTLLKVKSNFNDEALTLLGVKVGTKAGDIWIAQVPLDKVLEFTQLSGIEYIEMDQPSAPTLDTARRLTHVKEIHNGYALPQVYSGQGIVVGIVDAGFDYTHPTFYDTSYNAYRVKRVWEQKDTTGTSPSNFAYGSEYADSLSIITKSQDITDGTHGTHVGGIAAGSGSGGTAGSSKRFRGMAFSSDLVMVGIYPTAAYWLNTGMADMLDGINYVFNYASSVSKPAVANLSWGCPLGPRDGSSLFSQACDNLTGAGKIFVLSGGNNGSNTIHLQKTFTPIDTVVNTFLTFSTSLPNKVNWVDVWGDTAKSFCMKFSLYNGNLKKDSTISVCLDDTTHEFILIGSNNDTCFITVTTVSSEFNSKPHMLLQFYSRVADALCLTVTSNDGVVDMWQGLVYRTSGYYGTFAKNGKSWAVNGNSLLTTGDLVSTKSSIAVAAYNSKPSFTNVSGVALQYTGYTKGAIASFSSKGPTADGRVKPDIAGPGMALASAVSSVDSDYFSNGAAYNTVITTSVSALNGRTYSYAMNAGTSMSSPAVSGIVALLLEANPNLTPQALKTLLSQTAIQDVNTGVIPAGGSNIWGGGKVNAYAAIVQILGLTGIYHESSTLNCLLYPNPGNGNYMIEYVGERKEVLTLFVIDAQGKQLSKENWEVQAGQNSYTLDLSDYPKGIYFTSVSGVSGNTKVKIVKE